MHLRLVFLASLISLALNAQETEGFNTRLNAGFTLTDGNSDSTLLTLGMDTKNVRENREFLASATYKYGRTTVENNDGEDIEKTNVDSAKGKAQGNLLFSEKTYAFLNAAAERDEIADLKYRFLGGPGIGHYLIRNDDTSLSVEAGLVYVAESENGQEEDYPAFRAAQSFEHALSDTARLWQSLEYIPEADDTSVYLLNAEIGAEAKLGEKLALRLVATDKYDSDPAADAEENDLTLVAGLSYEL